MLANRYRVVRPLGSGGMGSVWLVEDVKLDNTLFAVKMLPAILVSNRRAYEQVKREALIALKLVHPNIVQFRALVKHVKNVSAFVYDDGELYMDIPKADYCAAYDDKGHMNHKITCAVCKKCLNGKTKVIGCKAH